MILKEKRDVDRLRCEWEKEPSFNQCERGARYHVDFGYSGALACRKHIGAWVNWTLEESMGKRSTEVITTEVFLEKVHSSTELCKQWLGREVP